MQQPDEWVRDVPSAAVGEEPQAKPEALCKPQCAAQFTSFVVHILTGRCCIIIFIVSFVSLLSLFARS